MYRAPVRHKVKCFLKANSITVWKLLTAAFSSSFKFLSTPISCPAFSQPIQRHGARGNGLLENFLLRNFFLKDKKMGLKIVNSKEFIKANLKFEQPHLLCWKFAAVFRNLHIPASCQLFQRTTPLNAWCDWPLCLTAEPGVENTSVPVSRSWIPSPTGRSINSSSTSSSSATSRFHARI